MLLEVLSQGETAAAGFADELMQSAVRGVMSSERELGGVGFLATNFFAPVVTNDSRFSH